MAMIEVERLHKRYGDVVAVDEISFDVREGEMFGFLGPNGAGKSTTMKILATLVRPTSGSARLNGFDILRQPHDVRRSIGMVFQDPSLDDRLTADHNLRFHAMLYQVPAAEADRRIDELLDLVELRDRRRHRVETFSGGMKRRLEIARGLLHNPRILFLDEPTLGLDPQTRRRIWEYIGTLRKTQGITLFMTTHYMDEAEQCDRIAIVDHGRIVALDTPAGLKQQVGGDVITLTSRNAPALLEAFRARFPDRAQLVGDDRVVIERINGSAFVPQVAAQLAPHIDSIAVREPTLDDVFIKLTGRAIRDETPSAADRMRMRMRAHRRRRG